VRCTHTSTLLPLDFFNWKIFETDLNVRVEEHLRTPIEEVALVKRYDLQDLIDEVVRQDLQIKKDAAKLKQRTGSTDGCNEQARKDKADIKQLKLDKDTLRRRVAYVKDQLAIVNGEIERLGAR